MNKKILILLVIMIVTVKSEIPEHFENNKGLRFCGRQLIMALINLCGYEQTNSKYSKTKRSSANDDRDADADNKEPSSIVEECCINSCLLKDFLLYC
uniref:Hormone peptide 1 Bombyxin-related peptide n=1 Tax=Lonomia obliqua TaxID=304329 RepID=Q5MGP2_LONON|nr:hormone peptide 1 Bombyxin-related peptide [Lonomia obliqua]